MNTQVHVSPKFEKVLEFLRSHDPEFSQRGDDFDLIEAKLIDSLRFSELLTLIEELTGAEIDLQELDIDSFRTVRSIRDGYFSENAPSA